jgi:endonuclease/exonuclease/phosphatase family metal-dependent hydrolase
MLKRFVGALVLNLLFLQGAAAQPAEPSSESDVPVIDWKDAAKFKGKEVVVQGKIVATRHLQGKICFLNFDHAHSVTVIIRQANCKNFPTPPDRMYDQKIIRARGKITEFRGKPQIEVSKPEQLTILEKELPLEAVAAAEAPVAEPENGVATIAAFNVLNMFDANDDPYTADEGTPAKPKEELEHLATAIRELKADVIALEEVENRGILESFVKSRLKGLGYEHVVHFEGNDDRGIDCSLISRFPIGAVTSHRHLRFSDGDGGTTHFQRDFLRVRIEPKTCVPFDMFLVHFKSKRDGSSTTENLRVAECETARRIIDDVLKEQPEALFLVCGDFNDTWDSKPLKALRGSGATELRGFVKDLPADARSYNRGRYTDVIDFILASPAMAKRYVAKSYKIHSGSVETTGSDHNPITAQFELKRP